MVIEVAAHRWAKSYGTSGKNRASPISQKIKLRDDPCGRATLRQAAYGPILRRCCYERTFGGKSRRIHLLLQGSKPVDDLIRDSGSKVRRFVRKRGSSWQAPNKYMPLSEGP